MINKKLGATQNLVLRLDSIQQNFGLKLEMMLQQMMVFLTPEYLGGS